MNKKAVAILLSLTLAVTMLAGCSKSSAKKEENKEQKIKITSYLWDKPDEKQYIEEQLIPEFKKQTGIDVDFEIVSNTDMPKYLQGQKDSKNWGTDVIISSNGDASSYIENGFVQPLDGVNATGSTFMSAFDNDLVVNNNRYFYPIAADVYLTIANKNALKYMPNGASIDNLTWEQYIEWSKNIAKGEGTPKTVMPALAGKSLIYQIGALELSYGSQFFPVMNDDGAVKAWDAVKQLETTLIKTSTTYPDPQQAMQSGEAWLSFFHMSPVTNIYKTAPEQYVVGPAPSGPAGKGTIAGASVIGIAAGSKNVEAAKKFIEFLIQPDTLYKVDSRTGGFIAPIQEVVNSLSDSPSDQITKMGIETLKTAKTSGVNSSYYTDWGAVKNIFETTFSDIMDGKNVDKAYLDAKQEKLDSIRKKQ